MAAITPAQLHTNISNACEAFESEYNQVKTRIAASEALYISSSNNGDFYDQFLAAFREYRNNLSSAFSAESVQNLLAPQWQHAAQILNLPSNTSDEDIIKAFFVDMQEGSRTFKRREMTFGTITADGSNSGDGIILRCTEDEFGFPINSVPADAKEFRILKDQGNSGVDRHNEKGLFKGSREPVDNFELADLAVSGDSVVTDFQIPSPIGRGSPSSVVYDNSSFSNFQDVLDPASRIPGWTVDTPANIDEDLVNVFRENPRGTSKSLSLSGEVRISRKLKDITIFDGIPYYLGIRWKQDAGAVTSAAFDIGMGTTSISVAIAGSEIGWQHSFIPLDMDSYKRNWHDDEAEIFFDLTAIVGTGLVIDDFFMIPLAKVDGSFYIVLGGEAPFLSNSNTVGGFGDVFRWTDVETTPSIITRLIAYAYDGLSAPNSTTPSEPDPSV